MNQNELFPEYIENIPNTPANPDAVLDNDALETGGLVRVSAWMRTKSSANALRVKKHQKRAEAGELGEPRKQLNIQAPVDEEARDALKMASAALIDKKITPKDLHDVSRLKSRMLELEYELELAEKQIEKARADTEAAQNALASFKSRPWWRRIW